MSVKALTWAKATTTGSASRKLVLLVLADYADEAWSCWPSQATIAEETELSVRQVRRILADLEEAGIVRREQRRRDDGYRTSDRIFLTSPDNLSPEISPDMVSPKPPTSPATVSSETPVSPDICDNLTGHLRPISPDTMSGQEPSVRTTREHTRAADPAPSLALVPETVSTPTAPVRVPNAPTGTRYPSDFEAWWTLYPRKTAKNDAAKAWKRARGKASWDELRGGLERAVAGWKRDKVDPQFIPHPATWLNGCRWEDQPMPARKPAGQSETTYVANGQYDHPDFRGKSQWA